MNITEETEPILEVKSFDNQMKGHRDLHPSLPQPPFSLCMVGPKGAGKSTVILRLIYGNQKPKAWNARTLLTLHQNLSPSTPTFTQEPGETRGVEAVAGRSSKWSRWECSSGSISSARTGCPPILSLRDHLAEPDDDAALNLAEKSPLSPSTLELSASSSATSVFATDTVSLSGWSLSSSPSSDSHWSGRWSSRAARSASLLSQRP